MMAFPSFTNLCAVLVFLFITIGGAFGGIQCQESMVYGRLDDYGSVYLDGTLVGTTTFWSDVHNSTAPCNATTLAFHAVNTYDLGGINGMMGRLATDLTNWRCSPTLQTDWAQPWFDDSAWDAPDKTWDTTLANDGVMHGLVKIIWNAGQGGDNAYCRGSRPLCTPRIPREFSLYRREYTPATLMVQVNSITARSRIACAASCLQRGECTCPCLHINGQDCLETLQGCCGYMYRKQTGTCTLYEAGSGGTIPSPGPGDVYYAARYV